MGTLTIAFDAIWIPIAITVIALGWAALMLKDIGSSGYGAFADLSLGIAWPSIPVLGAWLIWALLT